MSNNFLGFLKHGGNYLVASVATSTLAFISIPIYTRLLTPEDYGGVSVFMGIVSLLGSVMSFSTDRSVSRYFFDQKDELDFKRFVGTSSILALAFFIINSFVLILFAEEFGNFVGLDKNVVYLIIPVSIVNIIGLTFEQIYGPLKLSKKIAFLAVGNYLNKKTLILLSSQLDYLILDEEKYRNEILNNPDIHANNAFLPRISYKEIFPDLEDEETEYETSDEVEEKEKIEIEKKYLLSKEGKYIVKKEWIDSQKDIIKKQFIQSKSDSKLYELIPDANIEIKAK
jgi:hypothetical protein